MTTMHHITDPQLRRRLALGLTVPPPRSAANRRRRVSQNAVIACMALWLAGWVSCLAWLLATGR